MNMVRKKSWCIQNENSMCLCSLAHSLSLYRRCVVRKYQHRISGSTLVINHILYDTDTEQCERVGNIDLAFILMMITTMMMLPMMWPLCFLFYTQRAYTQFIVFRSLPVQQSALHKPTNIVKHWCKQGNKRFTAARYGLLMLMLASIFQFAWRTQIDCIR